MKVFLLLETLPQLWCQQELEQNINITTKGLYRFTIPRSLPITKDDYELLKTLYYQQLPSDKTDFEEEVKKDLETAKTLLYKSLN